MAGCSTWLPSRHWCWPYGLRVGISYVADRVVAGGIFQTRRWAWPRVGEFQVQVARMNGPYRIGANRLSTMLRVVEVGGCVTVLRTLVAQRSGPSDRSWLDDAACALNAQVLAHLRG